MTATDLLIRSLFTCLLFGPVACNSDAAPVPVGSGGSGAGGSGGSGQAGAGAGSTVTTLLGTLEGYCRAQCDERYRCGTLAVSEKTPERCTSDCVYPYGNVAMYRAEVMSAMQACLETLDCSRSIDECNLVGANVVSSDPENDPSLVACMSKQVACASSVSPFSDDICLLGLFFVESAGPAFDACVEQPCELVYSCFNGLRGR